MFHMKSVLKHRLFLSFRSDSLSLLLCFMAFMGVEQSGFMGVVYCLFSGPSVCVCVRVCVCVCVCMCVCFSIYFVCIFSICKLLFPCVYVYLFFPFMAHLKCLLFLCFTLCVSILSVSLYVLFHSLLPFLIVIVVDPFAR